MGSCNTSSRSFSDRGVPPGSRLSTTALPDWRNSVATRSMCVDLPAPSMPSKLMNKPRVMVFGIAKTRLSQADARFQSWVYF